MTISRIALILFAFSTSFAVEARTLKIATLAPDGTAWMQEMRQAAKQIKQDTDGRVEIKYFPGGVMGNDAAVLRKIRIGQLQGGAFTGGSAAAFYKDAQIYTLPFVFDSYAEVDYVRKRMDPVIVEGIRKAGFTTVGLSEGGFAYMLSRDPVSAVEDLSGKKVWIAEGDRIAQVAFEKAGISPVALPIPDVYTALQTGLLDTVTAPPTGAIAFQWHTKLRYLTEVPLTYLVGLMVIENKAMNRLSPADQAAVKKTMAAAFARLDTINREDNIKAEAALQQQGLKFVKPNANELARWKDVAASSILQLGKEGVYSQAMLDQMNRHLQAYRRQSQAAR